MRRLVSKNMLINLRKNNMYLNFEMLFLPSGYHMHITIGPIISGFLKSEWNLWGIRVIFPPSVQMTNSYDLLKNLYLQSLAYSFSTSFSTWSTMKVTSNWLLLNMRLSPQAISGEIPHKLLYIHFFLVFSMIQIFWRILYILRVTFEKA